MNISNIKYVFIAVALGLFLGLGMRRMDANYSYWCDIKFNNGTQIDGYTAFRPNGAKFSVSTANRDYIIALNLPNFSVANYTSEIVLPTMKLSNFRATNDESSKALIYAKKHTIALIKPHVLTDNKIGEIIKKIQDSGFKITELNTIQLTVNTAKQFYAEHANRTYFANLISAMTESPSIKIELEADDAVPKWRSLLADLRKKFAKDQTRNALHGSDSSSSYIAEHEILKNIKKYSTTAKTEILLFKENVGDALIELEKKFKLNSLNMKNMSFEKFTKLKDSLQNSDYIKVGEQKPVWEVDVEAEIDEVVKFAKKHHIDNILITNQAKKDL